MWLATLVFALPLVATAQENSTDSQQPEPLPNHPVSSTLDTGQTIDTDNKIISAIRVGHWSLVDAEFFYLFDSNYTFQPNNPTASNGGAARALVLYSRQNETWGIDFQYQPYLLVYDNGQQPSVSLAQQVDLHVYRHLTAHWDLDLDERFYYAPNGTTLINPTIIPNLSSGDIYQTPFLTNGQRFIQNSVTGSARDTINAKDTVTFHASYNYVNLANNSSTSSIPADETFRTSQAVGGGIGWTHEWHENQLVGLDYTYTRQILVSPDEGQQYHILLFTYSQKIKPTLLVRLAIGPSLEVQDNGKPSDKTFMGFAELMKTFRTSYLILSYSRNNDFSGTITDLYNNRWDASYSQFLGQRFVLSAGFGYIQQSSTLVRTLDGRDVWGRVDYNLTNRWGLFAQLVNSGASGGGQPYTTRNFVIAGLSWSSQPKHEIPE